MQQLRHFLPQPLLALQRQTLIRPPEKRVTQIWQPVLQNVRRIRQRKQLVLQSKKLRAPSTPLLRQRFQPMLQREMLVKQKPLIRFYWDSNSTVEQALASGELVASTGWNSSVVALSGQGVNIKLANPKEGIMSYCCGLVLAKDAPHLDKAYDLIDAMTSPEAGKWLTEAMGYGHSNKKTFELLDDKTLAELEEERAGVAHLL